MVKRTPLPENVNSSIFKKTKNKKTKSSKRVLQDKIELDENYPDVDDILSNESNQITTNNNLQILDTLLHPSLIANAKKAFQIEELTEVQVQAIPAILSGKDVLIKSRTGTGKTFAYTLPLVHLLQEIQPPITRSVGPIAVILLPTRELSLQTFEVLQKLVKPFIRIVPTCLLGGTNRKHEKDRIRKGVNILIGTPGRIEDHVGNTASLDLSSVRYVILDEADRMLDMGFQKSMETILEKINCATSKCPQKILLSATLGAKMHWLSTVHMNEPEFIDTDQFSTNQNLSNCEELDLTSSLPVHLKHFYLSVSFKLRLCALVAFILRKCRRKGRPKLIVFFSTNDSVLFHHEILDSIINSSDDDKNENISFSKLHGSMTLQERRSTLLSFSAQTKGVLVCTDVAARGLDFKRVTWIIQYNGPQTLVDYVHRSGRTARLDQAGKVLIFLDPAENQYLGRLSELGVSIRPLSLSMLLKSMVNDKIKKEKLPRKGIPNSLAAIDKKSENRVQNLQFSMEQAVNTSESLKKLARDAYASFVRGYASYGRDFKAIFHTRNLHLGHVAKSFALRETPSEIMRVCSDPNKNDERRSLNSAFAAHERLHPSRIDSLSEFSSGF